MLDNRSARLMSALTRICPDGSYKIIEISELIKSLMPRFRIDAAGLAQIIRFLRDNEMIDVKYSDDKVYCLSVLPQGRVYEEKLKVDKRENKFGRYGWLFLLFACAAASFVGAFLGVMFAGLFNA